MIMRLMWLLCDLNGEYSCIQILAYVKVSIYDWIVLEIALVMRCYWLYDLVVRQMCTVNYSQWWVGTDDWIN